MSRGRLVPPNLDDRTWQDIVNEARALIPQYAPQWTDHNPSDLGMTLVELFAWLVEGMIYRLNRVPEKNYIEFLNLLGITRDPATPAKTHVTFTVSNAPFTSVPKGTQVATPHTPSEEPVVFETDEELIALPINLTHLLYASKSTFKYSNYSKELVTGPLLATTLEIPAGNADGLFLGFDTSAESLKISFEFQKAAATGTVLLAWNYSQGGLTPDAWPPVLPPWGVLPPADDGTARFTQDGTVSLNVPADWEAQSPSDWSSFIEYSSPSDEVTDSRHWLVMWILNLAGEPLRLALRRVGFNSISATNALTVNVPGADAEAELLGVSNGEPFQSFALQNPPLFKQPRVQDPYRHLVVEIREPTGGGTFGPWNRWERVESFTAGDAEVYKCSPVTGEITFGNYDAGVGNGKIPPLGSEIRALTYRYVVGGVRGNVPPLSINVLRQPVPGVISVINPGSAIGGSDQEPIEETKRRAPEVLKNRDRAVTLADFEYLAREASTDIKKVRALPPRLHETTVDSYTAGEPWLFGGLDRSPARVNAIVVPDAPESPDHPAPDPQPKPDEDLLVEVASYLEQRRPAAVHLLATGPRYLPIRVVATINVWQSAIDDNLIEDPSATDSFRDSVVDQLKRFLHPTRGKEDGLGWEVGERIYVNQVFPVIQPLAEIGFIEIIELAAATPAYTPQERPPGYDAYDQGTWILVADYEMVCYGGSPTDITVNVAT